MHENIQKLAPLVFSLIELLIVTVVVFAFLAVKGIVINFAPPTIMINSLYLVKLCFMTLEIAYIIASFGLNFIMLIIGKTVLVGENVELLKNFFWESFSVTVAMMLMFLMSALAGILSNYNNGSISNEILLINVALYALFFVSLFGFVILSIASTFNAIKIRYNKVRS